MYQARRGRLEGGGVFRRLRKVKINLACLAMLATFVCTSVQPAFALEAGTNVTLIDSVVSVPNALTAASAAGSANLVPYSAAGDRTISYTTVNASGTKKYLQQVSSGAPSFQQVDVTDLSGIGTPTGTTNLVFSNSPTITSPTISTSVNLPADAVDAITEIANSIKTGTSATKVATIASGSTTTNGQCATWDANGNLTSQACSSGSVNAVLVVEGQTPYSAYATSTVTYMSLSGRMSATDVSKIRTPVPAGTWNNIRCTTNATVSTSVVVDVGKGACNGALTYGTLTTSITTADTTSTAGTSSITTTAGQCMGLKITKSSGQVSGDISCTLERTANS